MTRTNTDHVICDAQDAGAFRCMHCGDRHQPAFPVPLAIFCESAKGYALMHKHCLPKPKPTKQVELFDALAKKEIRESFAREIEAREIATDEPTGAISALTDEPAPEIDPPMRGSDLLRQLAWEDGTETEDECSARTVREEMAEHDKPELTDQDDPFGRRYPMAQTVARLRDDLAVVLQGVLVPTSVQLDLVVPADGGNGSVCSMHDYEPPGAISALTDEPAPEIDPPGPPPFCDHKFVDSKNCLKCGISFAELKAESLRESRRINGISDDPQSHGYGAAQDDPDPEHDKSELTDQDDPFGKRYPVAQTVMRLHDDLAVVLQGVLVPTSVQLDLVVPGSTLWDRLAHWTRVELCRANLTEHPELEAYLPGSNPMPKELAAMRKALKDTERKPKRGARPFSSPSAEMPVTPPEKKTRKRRSGSTQHTS